MYKERGRGNKDGNYKGAGVRGGGILRRRVWWRGGVVGCSRVGEGRSYQIEDAIILWYFYTA